MQEGGYLYEKFITFMKTERKTELLYFMVGCMAVNILLQRRLMLWVFLTLHAAVLLFLPIISRKKRIKQAPAWDARLVRIALVALLLMLLVVFVLAAVFKTTFLWEVPFIMSFLGFMTDTWILLANWITSPFEKIAGKKAAKAALLEISKTVALSVTQRGEAILPRSFSNGSSQSPRPTATSPRSSRLREM